MKKVDINKEKKRTDLLNASYELFTTKGVSNTTINMIAKKANVGKGTFYLYFKDKEEIRNVLIAQKSSDLLIDAIKMLNIHCNDSDDDLSPSDKIIFVTDYIITTLSKDISLLKYISKNLSWGMISLPFFNEDKNEPVDFRTYILSMLKDDGIVFEKNFDLMIFTIIELINSTCYNVILHEEPVSFSEYKPYLFNCIRLILGDAIKRDL